MRKMVNKQIALERTIVHPRSRRQNQLAHGGDDASHVIVARSSIYHYPIVATALIEIRFPKCPSLDRRIDETIVIFSRETGRCRCSNLAGGGGDWGVSSGRFLGRTLGQ